MVSAGGHSWVTASWGTTCQNCGMERPERGEWSPSCETVLDVLVNLGDPS